MLSVRKKTLIAALLLMFSSSQVVRAEVKLYQYDGKLPFVQMMLNMMVAMGILDRLPANGRYGMAGYPSSRWSGLSNPYMRALALRGFAPGTSFAGGNPFVSSPWMQSPWSSPGISGTDWGSPNWGVLPVESYARSPYGDGPYNSRLVNPYWSPDELDGWVNEPWETSSWNPKAKEKTNDKPAQSSQPQVLQTMPLVQNFNYNVPVPGDKTSNDRVRKSSPLAKLAPSPGRRQNNVERAYRQSPLSKRTYQNRMNESSGNNRANKQTGNNQKRHNKARSGPRQKPCITEFCGLKKPNLNGLWLAQDGEMLGIKNNRYLWSDSGSRYLTGKIKIENEYLLANIDGYDRLMRFKYKLAGNYLLTMQPDGKIREFTRMRTGQYNNYSQDGYGRGGYKQPYYQ